MGCVRICIFIVCFPFPIVRGSARDAVQGQPAHECCAASVLTGHGVPSPQVAYDKRSLRINDQPVMFLSGSVHPPRSSVGWFPCQSEIFGLPTSSVVSFWLLCFVLLTGTWDGIIQRAKSNGLNMIEVYVFWNYHGKEGSSAQVHAQATNSFPMLCDQSLSRVSTCGMDEAT